MERFEEMDEAPIETESKSAAKLRIKRERAINNLNHLKELKKNYRPEEDKKIKGDPQKTVFIGRLNYETTESTLSRYFGSYGEIRRLRLVEDARGKSKGYAFIEFRDRRGAETAYDRADGRKIDGKHIIVDMEKARIDSYWLPKRLGGGKGGESRRNKEDELFIREIRRELRETTKT